MANGMRISTAPTAVAAAETRDYSCWACGDPRLDEPLEYRRKWLSCGDVDACRARQGLGPVNEDDSAYNPYIDDSEEARLDAGGRNPCPEQIPAWMWREW